MPYVKRDGEGRIVSVHESGDEPGCVEIAADDEELQAFFARNADAPGDQDEFGRLDREFIRVIEDVIYLLIERRVFLATDLPEPAQRKLAERRNLRGSEGDLSGIVSGGDDFLLP